MVFLWYSVVCVNGCESFIVKWICWLFVYWCMWWLLIRVLLLIICSSVLEILVGLLLLWKLCVRLISRWFVFVLWKV